MKKNKITFLGIELVLLILALCFSWKIFHQNVPEKRVAVILPESGDKRWDSLIKGMKQSAKQNHIHLIICNTDEIESAEVEREVIKEQRNNNVDAFLIYPAPGSETEEMLIKECNDIPVILIGENVYNEKGQKSPVFAQIGPDYYEMGRLLGKQLGENGNRIGIVAAWEESESGSDAVRGFSEAIADTDSQIVWRYYQGNSQNLYEDVDSREKVDNLVVLAPEILDKMGEQTEKGGYRGTPVWGIGNSVKSVAMLDYGQIEGLVVPDGYETGYRSVEELAKKLNHKLYKLGSIETGIKVIEKKDLFLDEDIERFLYSYE